MILNATRQRAREPQAPGQRALLASLRGRRDPFCHPRRPIRVAQRLALGLSKAAVARAEGQDEAFVDRLLAEDGFPELIDAWARILEEPSAAFMARIEKLCRIALHNALLAADVGAALFARRELACGRDPARTLMQRIEAQARRRPPAPVAAAARPRAGPRSRDPLNAVVARSAAALRGAVVLEHAAQTAAAAPDAPVPHDPAGPSGPARIAGTAEPAAIPTPRLTRGP